MRLMKMETTNPCSSRLSAGERGSAILMAMFMIAVLVVMAAGGLAYLGRKNDAENQSSRWHQALSTAESGINFALGALNQEATLNWQGLSTAPAWTGWQRNKTATVGGTTYTYHEYSTIDSDSQDRRTIVQVNKVNSAATAAGFEYYRIRSMGTVALPGVSRASNDFSDIRLRKVAIGADWAAGRLLGSPQAMIGQRQVSRVVEVVAEPVVPFQFALFAVNSIGFDHMKLASYDSSDASRSIPKDDGTSGQKANVGSNKTSGVAVDSKAQGYVWGSGYTNGGSIAQWQQRLRWEYRTDVYTPTPSITTPPFALAERTMTAGGTVNIPASANSWATAYKVQFNGNMVLNGGNKLILNSGGGTHVIVYVNGNMQAASGNNILVLGANVKTKFYVNGNIELRGASVAVPSGKPGDFLVYGMKGTSATAAKGKKSAPGAVRTVALDRTIAAVYAPDHDVSLKANNDTFRGSLLARNIDIKANPHTRWYFDEALLDEDKVIGYRIVNWMEDAWTANRWYTKVKNR